MTALVLGLTSFPLEKRACYDEARVTIACLPEWL